MHGGSRFGQLVEQFLNYVRTSTPAIRVDCPGAQQSAQADRLRFERGRLGTLHGAYDAGRRLRQRRPQAPSRAVAGRAPAQRADGSLGLLHPARSAGSSSAVCSAGQKDANTPASKMTAPVPISVTGCKTFTPNSIDLTAPPARLRILAPGRLTSASLCWRLMDRRRLQLSHQFQSHTVRTVAEWRVMVTSVSMVATARVLGNHPKSLTIFSKALAEHEKPSSCR